MDLPDSLLTNILLLLVLCQLCVISFFVASIFGRMK
jgi:hypothetical protein